MLRTRAVSEDASAVAPTWRSWASRPRVTEFAAVLFVALLIAYLAITPLAPFASDPAGSEARRHLILSAVVVAYGLLLLVTRRLPHGAPLDLPILAVLGAVALAVWGSVDQRASLEWLLVVLPLGPLVVILRDRLLLSLPDLRRGVMIGTAAVSVLALVSVGRQWQDWLELVQVVEGGVSAGSLLPPSVPRVAGVGSHPNVLAAVLALALPFFVVSLANGRRRERIVAGTGLVLVGIALFFTLSRAAWAGAGLGCLVTGWAIFGPRLPLRSRRLWLVVAGGTAVAVGIAAGIVGGARPDWLFRDSLDPRADMRRVGIEIAREYPMTGAGPGMYSLLYAAHGGSYPFAAVHAHNTLIQIAADTGVIGLGAAALLLGTALVLIVPALLGRSPERRRAVALPAGVLTVFLVDGLADVPHLYPDVLVVLAVALAMLPARDERLKALHPRTVERPPFARSDAADNERDRVGSIHGRRTRMITAALSAGGAVALFGIGIVVMPLWWWNDQGARLHQRAVRMTAAGQQDDGIRLAEQAVNWDSDQPAHRAQLAAALSSRYRRDRQAADRERAIAEYERLLRAQPYLPAALVDLAALLLDRGDTAAARDAVDRLGRLAGGDRLLQVAHASLVEQSGTVDEAVDTYAGLLAIDPTLAATPLFRTGFRGEYADAIVERALARTAELGAAGAALESRQAAILVFAGRSAPDEAVVRRTLADTPDDPGTLVSLGRTLLAVGRTAEAEAPLRRAVARTGDSIEAREALGEWYAATGDVRAARHEWMIAAWLGSPRALNALGESYPAGAVPPAIVIRQQQVLAGVSAMRFGLLAQNFRFAFQRQEPAPIISQGDWLLALPDDFYRWSANLDRWAAERGTSR